MTNPPKQTPTNDPFLPRQRVSPSALVSFVPLSSWVRAAARCSFAIDPVLREIGVSVGSGGLNEVSITLLQSRQLIKSCVGRAKGEHFPFVFGEFFSFDAMPEIDTYLATCSSLRDVTQTFDWLRVLMSPALRGTLHEAGKWAQLRVDIGKSEPQPGPTLYFTEAWLASMAKLVRTLLGPRQLERITLRHSAPPYAEAYGRFFETEVLFDQPHDAIVLRRDLLDRPLHGAFPELHKQAEELIQQRVSKLASRSSISARLERLYLDDPALLTWGIEEIAGRLDMHVRTLQRRLHDEEQNFADLQARLRLRLACLMLRDTPLDLETISDRLGFSERRAFTRAFTRWAGQSPSAYRKDGPKPD